MIMMDEYRFAHKALKGTHKHTQTVIAFTIITTTVMTVMMFMIKANDEDEWAEVS